MYTQPTDIIETVHLLDYLKRLVNNTPKPTHAPVAGVARSDPFLSRERGFWAICPFQFREHFQRI